MVTRYCPDCGKKLPDGSRTRRRCTGCQRERTAAREKQYKKDVRTAARLTRDPDHNSGGKGCPFAGNAVDVRGLDEFLKSPRPAATHRSDASRDHRGCQAHESLD